MLCFCAECDFEVGTKCREKFNEVVDFQMGIRATSLGSYVNFCEPYANVLALSFVSTA